MVDRKLLAEAEKVRAAAYAPYSRFGVGAAIEAKDGSIFTGCNVENASYGLSICAEKTALVKAVSEGRLDFTALALVTDSDEPVMPCGSCRQVLAEFAPDLRIISRTLGGKEVQTTLGEIFPAAFNRRNLPRGDARD